MAERRCSRSRRCAPGRSRRPARRARSATAVWLPTASSSRLSRARARRFRAAHADHADPVRLVRIGTNSHRRAGQRVRSAARRTLGCRGPAAAREIGVARMSLSGGKAARRTSFPASGSRHQHRDLGIQLTREMGDHDPQQIVEGRCAGDLAAESIQFGRRARFPSRRLGLRPCARAERAGGTDTNMKKKRATTFAWSAMVNLIERRQEEEIIDAALERPRRRATARAHARAAAISTARRRPARDWTADESIDQHAERRRPQPS